MKTKLLLLFFVITFLLPLLVFVVIGLLDVQHPLLRYGVCIILSFCSVVGFILYMIKKKSSKWYLFFLIATLSLLIEVLTSPIRGYISIMLCSVTTFILYFLFMNYVLKKYSCKLEETYILYATLIGCSILVLPIHVISFSTTKGSLLDYLIHIFGIILGFIFFKCRKTGQILILTISIFLCLFIYFKGYDMWYHKLNYGTFTGKIESKQVYNLAFQTNSGKTLSLSDFKGKYLLIDCWYTYCGVCYQKMPKMQDLYDEYAENDRIIINSLHSYIKEGKNENYSTGSEILIKRQYTFPCWAIDINDPVLMELGVDGYPTVLIFDKQSNLIFRGNIENARKRIDQLLKENGK